MPSWKTRAIMENFWTDQNLAKLLNVLFQKVLEAQIKENKGDEKWKEMCNDFRITPVTAESSQWNGWYVKEDDSVVVRNPFPQPHFIKLPAELAAKILVLGVP